jgi:branched-chain amino acid transport system permease protein
MKGSITSRILSLLGLAIFASFIGWVAFNTTSKTVTNATNAAAMTLAFAGLAILTHYLGLLSLGQGAFIGVGAYCALHAVNDFGVPVVWMPLAGLIGGAIAGAVVAVPSLRLPKAYLALLTLSLAVAFPIVLKQIDGNLPVTLDGKFDTPSWTGIAAKDEHIWEFAIVLSYSAIALFLVQGILRGPIGRAFLACRDEPEAAAAFGIPVYRLRLYGVALSGGLAGLAGGLLLVPVNFNDYTHFPEELSIKMFALVIALGGASVIASVPSSIILIFLPIWLVDQNWVVERGWIGFIKSEGFIYAALLLGTAYLTKGKGFMTIIEKRRSSRQNRLAADPNTQSNIVLTLERVDQRLSALEGWLEGEAPDMRSPQDDID